MHVSVISRWNKKKNEGDIDKCFNILSVWKIKKAGLIILIVGMMNCTRQTTAVGEVWSLLCNGVSNFLTNKYWRDLRLFQSTRVF